MRKKERGMDYSGLATLSIFQQALEEEEGDNLSNMKHHKNGSINYVALMGHNQEIEVKKDFLLILYKILRTENS
jgi:hypothetical protein